MTIESKLPTVGTTIFTIMSKLAADEGAINLSQGYPDFNGPPRLLELVTESMHAGLNQYPPMTGIEPLREGIAAKVADLYGMVVDPIDEVTVTSGATEALFSAVHAIVRPGDEVIVFDPCYDSYEPAVTLAGGRCVHVPMTSDFAIDWQRAREAVMSKTRVVMVNSPHNPSGSVWTRDDIDGLRSVLALGDIYVVADEVYEHIVFDGRAHESLTRYPDVWARSFVVSSFGKTYHVTGWKVGYAVAPRELTSEFRKVHQFVTFTTPTPLQHALARFLEECPEHHRELAGFYQAKRDLFVDLLRPSRFEFSPSAGTFFQLLDFSAITNEEDTALARRWTKEVKVASIPISLFYVEPPKQNILRFCFAKDDATLRQAAEVLCQL